MPRVIRTLCFEELSIAYQPLLDTPIGKLSLRQTAVLLIFAVLAFLVASVVSSDLAIQLIVGGGILVVGVAVFGRKVKTLPPERLLLYMFVGSKQARRRKVVREEAAAEKLVAEKPLQIPNAVNISSDLDTPVKLVGVLRDPQSGRPLPVKPYDVLVDGEKVFSGVTDENGFFTIYFTPGRYGVFNVEVRPEKSVVSQKVPVQVVPKVRT